MTERFIPRSPVPSSTPRFKPGDGFAMRIDHGAKRWMFQHAARNLWRMSGWYDLDDLVQEGLLCWHRVSTYYRDSVSDRGHMMRLFQITFVNRVHALSKERTKRQSDEHGKLVTELPIDGQFNDDADDTRRGRSEGWLSDHGEQAAEIELHGLLANAPEPLRRLLDFIKTDDGPRRLRTTYRLYANGTRETFNQRVAHLIGWSGEPPDFRQLLTDYLGN